MFLLTVMKFPMYDTYQFQDLIFSVKCHMLGDKLCCNTDHIRVQTFPWCYDTFTKTWISRTEKINLINGTIYNFLSHQRIYWWKPCCYHKRIWKHLTCSSLLASLFLIHIFPCVCGSTKRGYELDFVTMIAFWTESSSLGRPCNVHSDT